MTALDGRGGLSASVGSKRCLFHAVRIIVTHHNPPRSLAKAITSSQEGMAAEQP